jgi:uncharacterized membrane protein (DUF2068 family)
VAGAAKDGRETSGTLLVWIGVLKLLKATLLVAVGLGAFRLVHEDAERIVREWVREMRVDPDNHLIHEVLVKLSAVTPNQLQALAAGTFIYAALFLVEGVGLVLRKRWAEYLTVVVTSLLIPLEVYELLQRFTVVRLAVLVVNVAIVVYLIVRLRMTRKTRPPAVAVGPVVDDGR